MERIIEKPRLYNWFVFELEWYGKMVKTVCGNVWGDSRFPDSNYLNHTSEVKDVNYDYEKRMCTVRTRNSVYYCPMEYCDYYEQEKYADLLESFEKIKEIAINRNEPSIDDGKILLTLTTFDDYYFHSMYYRKSGEEKPVDYESHAHIGTFQDSYLISAFGEGIDIRYFPHPYAISFYSWNTKGLPVYLENIGLDTICAETPFGIIKLDPGDRKLVSEENVEPDPPKILRGDLYPAAIF